LLFGGAGAGYHAMAKNFKSGCLLVQKVLLFLLARDNENILQNVMIVKGRNIKKLMICAN
jgi:hypothetical protein